MIKGLFEVHLITKPEHQSALFGYITNLNNDKLIRPRPTCAHSLYGNYPIQPMLTFWINGTVEDVTHTVKDIETDMNSKNIPVIRTKIEAMAHNEGVPNECPEHHYFEFHFKVDIKNTTDWNKLVELITPIGGHLFYNPYNKTLKPIVTIRRYTSLADLENIYKNTVDLLKTHGLESDSLEREYSVFDSNVHLDENWLFTGRPQNFITDISREMLFAY